MCGIAGILVGGQHPFTSLQGAALAMARTLAHRGPDDEGCWVDEDKGLALAHRRLAIVDLSPAGHQPMASSAKRYELIFNGEIYNHGELRKALTREGALSAPWRGHSDTETLLACIEAWGLEATLKACIGMFALALWDREQEVLSQSSAVAASASSPMPPSNSPCERPTPRKLNRRTEKPRFMNRWKS